MTSATKNQDRLVRNLMDFSPGRGVSAFDAAMRSGGPHITRLYLVPRLTESQEGRRYPGPGNGEILCKGAACGLCDDGRVRHYRSFNAPQRFVGFCEKPIDADTVF